MPHVAVIGGGISGLSAAWFLGNGLGSRVQVTVLEGSPLIGGKLRVSEIQGLPVDEGAESLLARRPEAVELARAVGLGDELVQPATTAASVWTRGRLRPLPAGQVMGVPTDALALARSGVLSPGGVARAALDFLLPRTRLQGDVAVGPYLRARFGAEVVDRLVEPLLGGVYAGRADELSLMATVPQVAAVASRSRSLALALRRSPRAARHGAPGPVFVGLPGGVGRLPAAVAAASGANVRTGATVRELARMPSGWRLTIGSTRDPEYLDVDAVVVAVPPAPAARLLADVAPAASAELGAIETASVAVITLVYPREAVPQTLRGSGFLVPAVDGRTIKAATFSSAKWAWLGEADPNLAVIRCSVGRFREAAELQRDDSELMALAIRDLAEATGVRGAPIASRVTRWGGGLPQYAVGHLGRVGRIRAAVGDVPGLAVCGATYDGVGVPACIASARAAADRILATSVFADGGEWAHG
jgi:oxygen-dependent protoporphyrinogen oxidase